MEEPQSLLAYRYRDAANYKANGAVLLSGEATAEHHRRLKASQIDGEYFIPEKVGLPSLRERLYQYSEGVPTSDDHLLHELVELRPATAEEVCAQAAAVPVEALVERFEAAAHAGWWHGIERLVEELGLDW